MSPVARKLAIAYFGLQGALTLIWWDALLAQPQLRPYFMAPELPERFLLAFLIPDVVLFAAGSLLAAFGLAQGSKWASAALWITTGSGCYASLYSICLAVLSHGAWGSLFMLPVLVLSPLFAWKASK